MTINPQSSASFLQVRRTSGIAPGNFRHTIGSSTSTATTHRQKVSANGGTIS
jgi:hypothetical protein